MSALVAGLRRAGSAHSLSAPKTAASSRSLPPSPSHTPSHDAQEAVAGSGGEPVRRVRRGVAGAGRGGGDAATGAAQRAAAGRAARGGEGLRA
ncbi:hypothetical protein MSG28_000207 [Choristoneura fumiferana]|uniref:Uncharacterized protein n=2 Tax=Choristoneura fumiferana TaxID=7141 RepID=A0ACC0JZU3_CHOFU|nr:hypothetical protein MSG28_000207 [Choristoneura fumiferana]